MAMLVALAACQRVTEADRKSVPAAWIPAGNEMERIVNAETGRTVRYLTSGRSIDTIFH